MMPLPVKKILCSIFFIFMMAALPSSLPSVSAATDRKPALPKTIDQNGCPLTLLKNKAYFHALSEKIRDARTQIVMAFFLFKTNGHPRSYPEILLRELGDAARRGVRVIVVLEQDARKDSTINRDNRNASERLKKAGVEVYFDSPKKTMHTKLAVIDGRYTFIGSHNLTQSALKHNHELSVLVDSPAVADKTLSYIKDLY
ncbi:MAG: phospholipase [Deltaproteobacteria bacterium HGW-Deltaproteobacteria-9]|nr:MAG: phospholipase [Deltaproteobacteria bacterium HGW-Deltaproteobacteria-9]